MIIQCPNCLAKFKLDDSKVKDEGTKVRCTKCKEVFLVTKEAPAAPPPSPPPPPAQPPEKEEFEFSFGEEEAPSGFAGPSEEAPKKGMEEEGFDFGEFGAKEEEKETGVGGISYGEVSLPTEEARPGEERFGFKEETPFGEFEFKEESFREEAVAAPREEPVPPSIAPPPIEEKVEAKGEAVGIGIEEKGEAGPEEIPFPELPAEKRRPFLKVAAIVIIILAIAALPLWYMWKGYEGAETGEITLSELNGYFTQNAEAGEIFVITGRVTNNTNRTRSFFQVRGTLLDTKGEKAAQKEVYIGNIFTAKEVETLPRGKIEADLKNKAGSSLSNINLSPGKSVPFMIVFFDLPKEMAEFTVEVTGSQVASE